MNEANIRKIIFSSELFSGFTVFVDITEHETLEDIEKFCVATLSKTLTAFNFIEQISRLNEMNFHIHDLSFEDIKGLTFEDGVYICGCCSMM